jgi:hypothetical protein
LRRSCEQLEAMQERACLASRAAELADVIYRSGRYEEAERWHAVASEYAASDDVGAQFLVGAIGAKLLARRGSFGAAERAGREAVRLAEQTDALNNRGKVLLDRAEGKPRGSGQRAGLARATSLLNSHAREGPIRALARLAPVEVAAGTFTGLLHRCLPRGSPRGLPRALRSAGLPPRTGGF